MPAERSSAISAVVAASSWNSARRAPASPSVASTATSGGDVATVRVKRVPVDGETGDGGLEPEPLQHGLGRRGRDGRDDVGARREPLGAASAAQRRPAAEEGRDDRRRRLAQRDGARAGLVGVEHVDGVEAAAHRGRAARRRRLRPESGRCGRRRRSRRAGRARRRPPAARAATASGQRRLRGPGRRSRRRPSSSSAGLRAGARMTTSWPRWASARASADQWSLASLGRSQAYGVTRQTRIQTGAYPDPRAEGSGCGHRAHTCPRAVQQLVHRVRVEAELGADLPRGAAAAGERERPALALREPADG